MGCCSCKPLPDASALEFPSESAVLLRLENEFPFTSRSAKMVVKELLSNERGNTVPTRNFQRALQNLEIHEDLLSDSNRYRDFIYTLRDSKDSFSTEKLVLVALLLGRGSLHTKLRVWFDFYDKTAKDELPASLANRMLKKLVRIASTLIPLLAYSELGSSKTTEYIDSLHRTRLSALLDRLIPTTMEQLTYSTLSSLLSTQRDLQCLFSAKPLREFLALCDKNQSSAWDSSFASTTLWISSPNLRFADLKPPLSFRNSEEDCEQIEERSLAEELASSRNPTSRRSLFSSGSECEPLAVELHLPQLTLKFVVYPDEDPCGLVEEFSVKHALSALQREKLLSCLRTIMNQ